jgi:hypothetical protein
MPIKYILTDFTAFKWKNPQTMVFESLVDEKTYRKMLRTYINPPEDDSSDDAKERVKKSSLLGDDDESSSLGASPKSIPLSMGISAPELSQGLKESIDIPQENGIKPSAFEKGALFGPGVILVKSISPAAGLNQELNLVLTRDGDLLIKLIKYSEAAASVTRAEAILFILRVVNLTLD